MKKIIFILALALMLAPLGSASAATDVFIKIDGVDGESTRNAGVEPDEIDARYSGDDDGSTSGNVETEFKVEKGESASDDGVEPDEIDNSATGSNENAGGTEDINIGIGELENTGIEPDEIDSKFNDDDDENEGIEPDEIDSKFNDDDSQRSNFAILLSGGSGDDSDGNDEGEEGKKEQVEDILLQEANQSGDVPMEEISLNFEKIETKVKQEVRLFGFIPVQATATVEIDAQERVKVKFPWWAFLASGKDDDLGSKVFKSLSDALERQHDTVMNIIGNLK